MEIENNQYTTIQIRVSLWKYLNSLKEVNESFDDVLTKLIRGCEDDTKNI